MWRPRLGAAALLAKNKSEWSGTYLALFQPGEETGKGAQAMIDDGLVAKLAAVKPDVCLAQHVLTVPESGHVATRSGAVLSAGDSIKVTVFGKGSHGSMPQLGVDPAVLASSIVMRLQGIVSREIAPGEFGVVTVGAIKVGSAPNVISDRAELLLNVRAYDHCGAGQDSAGHRQDRPRRVPSRRLPAGAHLRDPCHVPSHRERPTGHRSGDAGLHAGIRSRQGARAGPGPGLGGLQSHPAAFGVPFTYWGNGGFLPGMPVVGNHNPAFAPAIQPTVRTGTEAAIAATLAYTG